MPKSKSAISSPALTFSLEELGQIKAFNQEYDQQQADLKQKQTQGLIASAMKPTYNGVSAAVGAFGASALDAADSLLKTPESAGITLSGAANKMRQLAAEKGINPQLIEGIAAPINAVGEGLKAIGRGVDVGGQHISGLSDLGNATTKPLSEHVASNSDYQGYKKAMNDHENKIIGQGDLSGLKDLTAGQILTAGVSAIPSLAIMAAAPERALLTGGAMGAGGALNDAREYEKKNNIRLSDEQIAPSIAASALVNSVGEKIGIDAALGKTGISQMVANKFGNGIIGRALAGTIGAVGEGGTEIGQTIGENAGKKYSYDPKQSLSEGVLESALGGIGGGGAVGMVHGNGQPSASQATTLDEMLKNPITQPGDIGMPPADAPRSTGGADLDGLLRSRIQPSGATDNAPSIPSPKNEVIPYTVTDGYVGNDNGALLRGREAIPQPLNAGQPFVVDPLGNVDQAARPDPAQIEDKSGVLYGDPQGNVADNPQVLDKKASMDRAEDAHIKRRDGALYVMRKLSEKLQGEAENDATYQRAKQAWLDSSQALNEIAATKSPSAPINSPVAIKGYAQLEDKSNLLYADQQGNVADNPQVLDKRASLQRSEADHTLRRDGALYVMGKISEKLGGNAEGDAAYQRAKKTWMESSRALEEIAAIKQNQLEKQAAPAAPVSLPVEPAAAPSAMPEPLPPSSTEREPLALHSPVESSASAAAPPALTTPSVSPIFEHSGFDSDGLTDDISARVKKYQQNLERLGRPPSPTNELEEMAFGEIVRDTLGIRMDNIPQGDMQELVDFAEQHNFSKKYQSDRQILSASKNKLMARSDLRETKDLLDDAVQSGEITQENADARVKHSAHLVKQGDMDGFNDRVLSGITAVNGQRQIATPLPEEQRRDPLVPPELLQGITSGDVVGTEPVIASENQPKNEANQAKDIILDVNTADGVAVAQSAADQIIDTKNKYSTSGEKNDLGRYSRTVDAVIAGAPYSKQPLNLGETPAALQALGARDVPLSINPDDIHKAVNKHGLTADLLKQVPDSLQSPVMVFDSKTERGALVALTELHSESGKPIVVAIHLDKKSGFYRVNEIASIHGKDSVSSIQHWLNDGLLRYQDSKKSLEWLHSHRLYLPQENTNQDPTYRVITEKDLVKQGLVDADGHGEKESQRADFNKEAVKKSGLSAETLQVAIDKANEGMKNAGVTVVQTVEDAEKLASGTTAEDLALSRTDGFFNLGTKQIVLIADAIDSVERGLWTMAHEQMHRGLDGTLGKKINHILIGAAEHPGVRRLANAIMRDREWDHADPWLNVLSIEEALAELNAARITGNYDHLIDRYSVAMPFGMQKGLMGTIARTIGRIKAWLAKFSGKPIKSITDEHINDLFRMVDEWTQSGTTPEFDSKAPAGIKESRVSSSRIKAETNTEYVKAEHINGFARVENIENQLKEMGIKVSFSANDAEAVFHGRQAERIGDFQKNQVKALAKAMFTAQTTAERVDWFALARHAEERNKHIAGVNPSMPDGGSGLSTQQANDLLAGVDVTMAVPIADEHGAVSYQQTVVKGFTQAEQGRLTEVMRHLDAITAASQTLLEEYGLEDKELIKAWKKQYKNYVPLAGLVGEQSNGAVLGAQSGFSVRGGQKRAAGRRSIAPNILEQVLRQYEDTVRRGEKNVVAKNLVAQAVQMDNDRVMPQAPNGKPLFEVAPTDLRRYFKEGKLIEAEMPVTIGNHILTARIDGKDVAIRINDPALAQAARNLDAAQLSGVLQAVGSITSALSMLYTASNPMFWPKAFIRDVFTVATLGQRYGGDFVKQTMGNLGPALKVSFGANYGTESADFKAFRMQGGRTGYIQAERDLGKRRSTMEQQMVSMGDLTLQSSWPKLKEGLSFAFEKLIAMGDTLESGVRYAAWMTAKQQGKTPAEAAKIAKEVTVNFNRKGRSQTAAFMKAFYPFYNASLQGASVMASAMPKRRVQVAIALVSAAVLLTQLALLGGMDDDDRERLLNNPVYQRDRIENLLIFTGNKERPYMKLSLPNELQFAAGLSSAIADQVFGGHGTGERGFGAMMDGLAGSFLIPPLSSVVKASPIKNGAKAAMAAMTPGFAQPFAQAGLNVNFAGNPLMPENDYNKDQPDAYKAWRRNQTGWASRMAIAMNEITGGNRRVSGWVDLSPETINNAVRTYTGGLGSMIAQGVDVATNPSKEWLDAPIISGFSASPDALERGEVGRAQELSHKAKKYAEDIKALRRYGDVAGAKVLAEQAKEDFPGGLQAGLAFSKQMSLFGKMEDRLGMRDDDAAIAARQRLAAARQKRAAAFLRGVKDSYESDE